MTGHIISVDSSDDPRLAPYLSIREKDLTGGHGGRFIVEGKVTLEALLLRSRFRPESLFLAESRMAPLHGLRGHVPPDVPIYVAPQSIMDAVTGFPIHRGVLACGFKGSPLDAPQALRQAHTVLVLVGLSNHDNTGACFRNAAAFGVDLIMLDGASCDPLYRKSIRVSAGTALSMPFVQAGTGADIFSALAEAGFAIWSLTPRTDAPSIGTLTRPPKLALVLGPEGAGLPENLLMQGRPVRIPMAAGFDSLNVATAGAIALSAAFQQDGFT